MLLAFLCSLFTGGICFIIGAHAGAVSTRKDIFRIWKEIDDELRKI